MELRWYFEVFIRHARLIILGTLMPGVISLVISLIIPPTYQASSEIVLFKSKAEITLNPQFQTLTEDQLIRLSGQDPRRQTLAALTLSDQVLSDTISNLPRNMQQTWSMTKLRENAQVETTGNLLKLSVNAGNPEEAATVTNTWAETFAQIANQSFKTPSDAIDSINHQVEASSVEYKNAENRLINFLENNQIDELKLQIEIKEQAIKDLTGAYTSASQIELTNLLVTKQQLPQIAQQIAALTNMVSQLPEGSSLDQSTQVALLLLQIRLFNAFQLVPTNLQTLSTTELQINIPSSLEETLTRSQAIDLLNQMDIALKDLDEQLQNLIDKSSNASLQSPGPDKKLEAQIRTLQKEVDELKASLENEEATLKELTSERDLTWNNYNILSQKSSEVSIANKIAETEVVIATGAVPPEEPYSPRVLLNTVIGFALGFVATSMLAFIKENLAMSNQKEA